MITELNKYNSFSHCGSNIVLGPSHIQNKIKSRNIALYHKLHFVAWDSFISLNLSHFNLLSIAKGV